jgi:hypothetical protein
MDTSETNNNNNNSNNNSNNNYNYTSYTEIKTEVTSRPIKVATNR